MTLRIRQFGDLHVVGSGYPAPVLGLGISSSWGPLDCRLFSSFSDDVTGPSVRLDDVPGFKPREALHGGAAQA